MSNKQTKNKKELPDKLPQTKKQASLGIVRDRHGKKYDVASLTEDDIFAIFKSYGYDLDADSEPDALADRFKGFEDRIESSINRAFNDLDW